MEATKGYKGGVRVVDESIKKGYYYYDENNEVYTSTKNGKAYSITQLSYIEIPTEIHLVKNHEQLLEKLGNNPPKT